MSSIEKAVERMSGPVGETPAKGASKGSTEGAAGAAGGYHINLERLEEAGYLTPASTQGRIGEEYRLLKRPLLMNAFGKGAAPIEHGNLIMVTSALPGEGKTFSTLNLAMSMAVERDVTVLLIDSDVVKPGLSRLLGLEGRPGLIDVLTDDGLDLSDVIVRTDIPSLRVLPAGKSHRYSTELLASDAMASLTAELAQRYHDRVVLFDSPPLMASSQAQVLGHLVGQILVVVEANRTPQRVLTDALNHLDANKVIGLALNKCSRVSGGEYYGGYYGSYG